MKMVFSLVFVLFSLKTGVIRVFSRYIFLLAILSVKGKQFHKLSDVISAVNLTDVMYEKLI